MPNYNIKHAKHHLNIDNMPFIRDYKHTNFAGDLTMFRPNHENFQILTKNLRTALFVKLKCEKPKMTLIMKPVTHRQWKYCVKKAKFLALLLLNKKPFKIIFSSHISWLDVC